jgi:hypothetical protein
MQISFTIDADAFELEQKEPVKKTLRIGDAEIAHALAAYRQGQSDRIPENAGRGRHAQPG